VIGDFYELINFNIVRPIVVQDVEMLRLKKKKKKKKIKKKKNK